MMSYACTVSYRLLMRVEGIVRAIRIDLPQNPRSAEVAFARSSQRTQKRGNCCEWTVRAFPKGNHRHQSLERKADIAHLQNWLGHASISTSRHYDRRRSRPEESPTLIADYLVTRLTLAKEKDSEDLANAT